MCLPSGKRNEFVFRRVHLILFYFYYYFFPFSGCLQLQSLFSLPAPRPTVFSLPLPHTVIGLSQELGAHHPAAVFDRSQKQRQRRRRRRLRLRLRLLDRSSIRRTKHIIIIIIIFFVPLAVLRTLYIMCTSPPAPRPRPKKELNVFLLM